ncbi:MAG: hypothetical protein AAF621_02305 [Pseudomonadota bacterium]
MAGLGRVGSVPSIREMVERQQGQSLRRVKSMIELRSMIALNEEVDDNASIASDFEDYEDKPFFINRKTGIEYYKSTQPIGAGGTALIFKVMTKQKGMFSSNGDFVAKFYAIGTSDEKRAEAAEEEEMINHALQINLAKFIRMVAKGQSGDENFIILQRGVTNLDDFFNKGTFQLLSGNDPFQKNRIAATILKKILENVLVFYKNHFCHNDMKLPNLVLDTNGLMVIDYGLATRKVKKPTLVDYDAFEEDYHDILFKTHPAVVVLNIVEKLENYVSVEMQRVGESMKTLLNNERIYNLKFTENENGTLSDEVLQATAEKCFEANCKILETLCENKAIWKHILSQKEFAYLMKHTANIQRFNDMLRKYSRELDLLPEHTEEDTKSINEVSEICSELQVAAEALDTRTIVSGHADVRKLYRVMRDKRVFYQDFQRAERLSYDSYIDDNFSELGSPTSPRFSEAGD